MNINKLKFPTHKIKKSVEVMYGQQDLEKLSIFQGGYINWGYYKNINLNAMTKKERALSSEELYKKSASYLSLNPKDSFLEIGCGKGKGLEFLIKKFNLTDVTAIDQSDSYINEIKEKNPKISISKQNSQNFCLNKKFKKILSLEMAQHLTNIESFIKNVEKHIAKDGIFVLATFFSTDPSSKEKINNISTINDGTDQLHFINDIKDILNKSNFEYEIISIGEDVFYGYDKWISQTNLKNSWARNWLKAYKQKLIDYFVIKSKKTKTLI